MFESRSWRFVIIIPRQLTIFFFSRNSFPTAFLDGSLPMWFLVKRLRKFSRHLSILNALHLFLLGNLSMSELKLYLPYTIGNIYGLFIQNPLLISAREITS
jgi:hypothetical protein